MKLGSGNHKSALKTANNDVTGDTIVTGKGSMEKYAAGWDAIFGKKKEEAHQEPEEYEMGSEEWYNELMKRAQTAFSGESIKIPQGLSREELRDFIFSVAQNNMLGSEPDVVLYGGYLGGGKSRLGELMRERREKYPESFTDLNRVYDDCWPEAGSND